MPKQGRGGKSEASERVWDGRLVPVLHGDHRGEGVTLREFYNGARGRSIAVMVMLYAKLFFSE